MIKTIYLTVFAESVIKYVTVEQIQNSWFRVSHEIKVGYEEGFVRVLWVSPPAIWTAEMSEQQLPDYPQLLFALLVMLSSFQEVWLYMWSLQNKPR